MSNEGSDLLHGTLGLMILRTLETLGAQHGYGIARRIEQTSGDLIALNQGTLYPALLRLEPRVERRVEPARQPVAGETYPGHRDRRHAGRQQHHGWTAKRSGHERHQLMVCGRTGG